MISKVAILLTYKLTRVYFFGQKTFMTNLQTYKLTGTYLIGQTTEFTNLQTYEDIFFGQKAEHTEIITFGGLVEKKRGIKSKLPT